MSQDLNHTVLVNLFSVPVNNIESCQDASENIRFSCLCKNKDADQLCSNCTADQHLCFRYSDSKSLLLKFNFQPPSLLCDCTGQFVSDLVGNPEDWFSCIAAQIILISDMAVNADVIVQMLI